jgi:signal transduction histidine kinase
MKKSATLLLVLLTVVSLGAQAPASDVPKLDIEKYTLANGLDVILSEVQRLEKMVQDIETYVQFTSRHQPCFAPVQLCEVLAGAVASVRGRFPDWEGRIREDNRTLTHIYADRGLLRDLFEGLVENAFDAMPRGGNLSVASEAVGNWVRVRVGDTGRGIAQEDLESIFDPFFTSKTQGAGLGLAKAYMIVEEHSGTIEFDSQVGKGTVCTVSLPVERRRVPRAVS